MPNSMTRLTADRARFARSAFDEMPSSWSDDLRLVVAYQFNAQFVGPDEASRALIDSLRQHFAAPLIEIEVHAHEGLMLPVAGHVRTLVCYHITMLGAAEQHRLMGWLDHAVGRTQVISTASMPILPLVDAGRFNEALYYRLNTLHLDLTRSW